MKNQFVRNVIVMASGTAGAQAILLLASPILTRIFSPESFGLLAVFMAIVTSFLPSATGRYEVASMLPKNNKVALEVLVIGFWFSGIIVLFFTVLLFLAEEQIVIWLKEPRLRDWLIFIPFAFLVLGWSNAIIYRANRSMNYHLISVSKFIQAISMLLFSGLLSWLGFKFSGLLMASLLGPLSAFLYLFFMHRKELYSVNWRWSRRKWVFMKKYKDFPLYNAAPSVLDGLTVSLPVFYITNIFTLEELGYYSLVMRVIYAPVNLLAASVGQVNLKKIVDLVHAKAKIEKHIYSTSLILFAISLIPVFIFGVWGPSFFSLVFGEQWSKAGVIAQIAVFALSIKFVSSSLSTSVGATNNSHLGAIWKLLAFVSTIIVLFFMGPYETIEGTITALVRLDIILYIIYFALIIKAVKNPRI